MPVIVSRPIAIFGVLMLSATIVSCNGTKQDIASVGSGSFVHVNESPVSSSQSAGQSSAQPEEVPFHPDSPSLCGIGFGDSEGDVIGLYGVPTDSYSLPGDDKSIQIWEYTGFSVGMNADNKVVYVEINSTGTESGIQGLSNGMEGTQAAELLGAEHHADSNVISLKVAGGSLKLDLDPDSQTVLSLKLISNDI
jgi:hypothetical protein